MRHIPAATLETAQFFAHPHSQKPARFPAGQNERFHPAKPSFYPPAVTAGITHYTLQAKSCAKGASPLETSVLPGSRCDPQNRGCAPSLQNASRRHRPARLRERLRLTPRSRAQKKSPQHLRRFFCAETGKSFPQKKLFQLIRLAVEGLGKKFRKRLHAVGDGEDERHDDRDVSS